VQSELSLTPRHPRRILAPLLGYGTTFILWKPPIVDTKIGKKKSIKKKSLPLSHILHTSRTSRHLQETANASYKLNCPEKITVEKYIKIIMPTVDNYLTAMVCHVGLHVDFHPRTFLRTFRPSPPSMKWTWTVSAFSTNERSYIVMVKWPSALCEVALMTIDHSLLLSNLITLPYLTLPWIGWQRVMSTRVVAKPSTLHGV
jgi:hypothetical protein